MKKTRLIELLAHIRATLVSFLSIVMFVALGVGVFLGIRGSAVSLEQSAEQLFADSSFHDFEILYPYGLSDDDLAAIAAVDGVDSVVGIYRAYAVHSVDGNGTTFAIHSITDGVDECAVVEGSMPSRPDEIAINSVYASNNDIHVGDYIVFDHDATDDDPDGMAYLTTDRFKVTATITSPLYLIQLGGTLGITSSGGSIGGFAFVQDAAFDPAAFLDMHPGALVRASSLRGLPTFSNGYRTQSDELKETLETLGEPRAKARYDELYSEARQKLDDAEAQLAEGERMLDDANRQIEEGEDALERGELQLENAIAQLETGQATYEQTASQGEQMLGAMEGALSQLQTAYDTAKAALDTNAARVDSLTGEVRAIAGEISTLREAFDKAGADLRELDQELADGLITDEEYAARRQAIEDELNMSIGLFNLAASTRFPTVSAQYPELMEFPEVSLDTDGWLLEANEKLSEFETYSTGASDMLSTAQAELAGVQAEVDRLDTRLSEGWAQFYAARDRFYGQLADTAARLEEGRRQAEEGRTTLDEKSEELEEGKRTVAEKTEELDEGRSRYEEAKAQVDAMVSMNWIVNDRFSSGGAIMLRNVIDLTNNLRIAMASLFLLVGLLVCYSAVSRIVHDQVTQIGAKKALGFREGEVTAGYLAYTALAIIAGVLLGQIVSVFVVQAILYGKLAENFDVPRVGPSLMPFDTLLITAFEMVLLLAITWLACRSVLKRSAIELLAGEQKSNSRMRFYERWGFWRKLPLLTQTVINNCVNDPRRVFATLIGVAGCTALVVTASTLKNNITRSIEGQFGLVYDFNATVSYDGSEETLDRIDDVLDAAGCTYAPLLKTIFLLEGEEGVAYDFAYVPVDEDSFSQLFHLNVVPMDGEAPTGGVWLSEAHAEHRGLRVGDIISLHQVSGEQYKLTVAGFFSNYQQFNAMVMSPAYYERAFGHPVVPNTLIVDTGGMSVEDLRARLEGIEGFTTITDEEAAAASISNLFSGITTTTVIIYVALSALMAIVVLLNLDVMFIDEKKRELIVLMINGFSVKDAKGYIYRDAIVMTVLGIIAGVGLGTVMGGLTVGAVEWQTCSFMKDPDLPSCLLGAGVSAFFAVAMMIVALRRIPRFSLTDISKF